MSFYFLLGIVKSINEQQLFELEESTGENKQYIIQFAKEYIIDATEKGNWTR